MMKYNNSDDVIGDVVYNDGDNVDDDGCNEITIKTCLCWWW